MYNRIECNKEYNKWYIYSAMIFIATITKQGEPRRGLSLYSGLYIFFIIPIIFKLWVRGKCVDSGAPLPCSGSGISSLRW